MSPWLSMAPVFICLARPFSMMNDFNPGANPFHGPVRLPPSTNSISHFPPQLAPAGPASEQWSSPHFKQVQWMEMRLVWPDTVRGRLLQPLILPHSLPVSLRSSGKRPYPTGFLVNPTLQPAVLSRYILVSRSTDPITYLLSNTSRCGFFHTHQIIPHPW